jgi:hypothetical protein
MGDVIYIEDFKKRKEKKKKYKKYVEEAQRLSPPSHSKLAITHYQFALDKQTNTEFYLNKYFFPDFDW